ncbi:CD27 antigen isoform X2 [Cynoglossus semilaevis]|uniref:CD27 antigen isoform X2 n=1 Tax=Cynoglossus semilaevis TaxID=244447 RepID=UPI000D629770|nr:tumor necrosis factor receptor superfamily member 3 isoform X2 [Cynoglossus semilaevis]
MKPLTRFSPLCSLVQRGSQATRLHLIFCSRMQTRYVWFTLLCCLPFLCAELSLQCSPSQYAWPSESPRFCCEMCKPGTYMQARLENTCGTKCGNCSENLYSDSYNIDLWCKRCEECDNLTTEYVSHCNGTHNAVCRCKAGYRCKDNRRCTVCVLDPHTTTEPPTTTTDTVWFLVVTALLCSVTALFVITKLKPFLHWIRSRRVLQCPKDDDVSKPVQEVCGKCDQPIDI